MKDPNAKAHAQWLNTILLTNPRLNLEIKAAISRLFRENNVPIADEILAQIELTIAGAQASGPRSGNVNKRPGPPPNSPDVPGDDPMRAEGEYRPGPPPNWPGVPGDDDSDDDDHNGDQ